MANTTFKNIQDRCLALGYGENDRANFKLWINEVDADIFGRHNWNWARGIEQFNTAASTSTYTISSTLSGNLTTVDRLRPITSGLAPITFIEYYSDQRHDFVRLAETDTNNTTGYPVYWSAHGDEFFLYPTPDAVYTYQAEGQLDHTELSADGDAIAIPAEFRHLLIHGACARAALRDRMPQMYEIYNGQYERGLDEMKVWDRLRTATAQPQRAALPSMYGDRARWRK